MGDKRILVLGIGNSLLSDDGIGVHVVEALRREEANDAGSPLALRDGGTLGLSLLPEIEASRALIMVDAVELGTAPGEVRSFEGAAMDALVAGRRGTAHAVATADLMAAALLSGCRPARRALVAVQPESTGWGTEPSRPVAAAVPRACAAVRALAERWTHDG